MKRLLLFSLLFATLPAFAQLPDQTLLGGLKYRCIGPFRGGRSLACAGLRGDRTTYYFGATGGGVWKTTDGGDAWFAVSDSAFKTSSVGAIAVAASDENVIYVGMGECDIRGNISGGDGVYKSVDAGNSWKNIGLKESYAVAKIAVHPANPDLVFAASMGHIFGVNAERGVFRSSDGGASWKNILFRNDSTGAIDVQIDPNNPRILYAALWQASRNAYNMTSGGAGSGLFKSADGGDTWQEITRNPGMPKGLIGKIRVAVSPAKSGRLWAMVENEKAGGLFRSDDAGKTWQRATDDRAIRQRPWYFSHIVADPKNPEVVYALNVGFHKSSDGGKTFSGMNSMHGDHHDLWIDPNDPQRFILADDGGAAITTNGGKNLTELDIPTAQFYHVTLDNQFPYRIFGAQQDNTSVVIASRTSGGSINRDDWFNGPGCECGYTAPDPANPDVMFGGCYGGMMTRLDAKAEQELDVSVYPENVVGSGANAHKYRFQWTYPIVFSPHDPATLYACGNHVFRSKTGGTSWEQISPDLTTNDPLKLLPSGGMISKDNTGVETYCTIFAFAESPVQRGILWAGSDDGLVHISSDNGANWTNVTPKNLPAAALISIIEPSHFAAGTAYLAATRYKSADDRRPYLYKTEDYGKSWKQINAGIPDGAYTRVIREDPVQRGLLFAGTETGVFVSANDGATWQPLQLNLPVTPIHDLAIHQREHDLVVATHGRSFWILDNITPLRELAGRHQEYSAKHARLFVPRHSYRVNGGAFYSPMMQTGQNAPNGVVIDYYLPQSADKEITLEFYDARDSLIISLSSKKDRKGEPLKKPEEFIPNPDDKRRDVPSADSGLNRFVWNMRYPDATESPVVTWGASTAGPKAVPGRYSTRLKIGDTLAGVQQFEIRKDPRIAATPEDFAAQFQLLLAIRDKVNETHEAVNTIRDIRAQINGLTGKIEDTTIAKPIKDAAKPMLDTLAAVEEELVQTKAKSGQDLLNFPMKLNNKLAALTPVVASADSRPTAQAQAAFRDISSKIEAQLLRLKHALETGLPAVNGAVKTAEIPAVAVKKRKK